MESQQPMTMSDIVSECRSLYSVQELSNAQQDIAPGNPFFIKFEKQQAAIDIGNVDLLFQVQITDAGNKGACFSSPRDLFSVTSFTINGHSLLTTQSHATTHGRAVFLNWLHRGLKPTDQVRQPELGANFFTASGANDSGIAQSDKNALNIEFLVHDSATTVITKDLVAWGKSQSEIAPNRHKLYSSTLAADGGVSYTALSSTDQKNLQGGNMFRVKLKELIPECDFGVIDMSNKQIIIELRPMDAPLVLTNASSAHTNAYSTESYTIKNLCLYKKVNMYKPVMLDMVKQVFETPSVGIAVYQKIEGVKPYTQSVVLPSIQHQRLTYMVLFFCPKGRVTKSDNTAGNSAVGGSDGKFADLPCQNMAVSVNDSYMVNLNNVYLQVSNKVYKQAPVPNAVKGICSSMIARQEVESIFKRKTMGYDENQFFNNRSFYVVQLSKGYEQELKSPSDQCTLNLEYASDTGTRSQSHLEQLDVHIYIVCTQGVQNDGQVQR